MRRRPTHIASYLWLLVTVGLVSLLFVAAINWGWSGARQASTANKPTLNNDTGRQEVAAGGAANNPSSTRSHVTTSLPEQMQGDWVLAEIRQGGLIRRTAVEGLKTQSSYFRLSLGRTTGTVHNSQLDQRAELRFVLHENRPNDCYRFEAQIGDSGVGDGFQMKGFLRTIDGRLFVREEDAASFESDALVFERPDNRPVTVFVVHGTYDATSDWVRDLPGKVTFTSELKRCLGDDRTTIEPFMWRSSIHHTARMQAADNLAELLDHPRLDGRQVVLIGHSHGGNVCLAAAGKCRRSIDATICLATPHFHVMTQSSTLQSIP